MQQRQRNAQKSVMHVQGCCFANLNPLLFSGYHCRRHRRYCLSCLCLDDRSTLGTKITCFPWSLGTRSVFTTFETRWRLSQLNFAKTSGTGKNWPLAERHALRNDPRSNCGTLSVLVPFSLPKWRMSGLLLQQNSSTHMFVAEKINRDDSGGMGI